MMPTDSTISGYTPWTVTLVRICHTGWGTITQEHDGQGAANSSSCHF